MLTLWFGLRCLAVSRPGAPGRPYFRPDPHLMILHLHDIQAQYAPEVALLRFQFWRHSLGLADFCVSMNTVAQLVDQNVIVEGLIDLRGLPNMSLEKQFWVATHWLRRVSMPSVQHVAFIMPTSGLYNQMVIESLHQAARHFIHYEVQFFSETTSALDWLLSYQDSAVQVALEREWAQHPISLPESEE